MQKIIAVKKFIAENITNSLHPIKHLELGNFGYNNFQRLRYSRIVKFHTNSDTNKFGQTQFFF